jgi:hypothetical protein
MRRMLLLLTVIVVMSLVMATTAGAAFARATGSNCSFGNVTSDSGNFNAHQNCTFHF